MRLWFVGERMGCMVEESSCVDGGGSVLPVLLWRSWVCWRIGRVGQGLLLVEGLEIPLLLLLEWRGVWFLFSVLVVVEGRSGKGE